MPVRRLRSYLDKHGVRYRTLVHSPAYTAQEVAAVTHVRGREMAKTVMVKIDGDLVMAVLPATYQVDLYELMGAFGADRVQLATEDDFRHLFPGCELGAMPPFGNLYGVDVYVARELTEQEEMAFNAGSHTEILRMPYRDYARLVMPLVLDFAVPERAAA